MASITFNSTDFSSFFILTRDSFSQPSSPNFSEFEIIGGHGSVLQSTSWASQIITVNGILTGTSYSDLKSNLHTMKAALYAVTEAALIFSDESDIEYVCKLQSMTTDTMSPLAIEVSMEFISPQPGRDVTPTETALSVGSNTIDTSDSNFIVYPTFHFEGLTSPVNLSIETPSSSKLLTLTGYTSAGTLDIDCTPGNRQILEGTTNKMEYLSDGSTWPELLAGEASNEVTVTISAGTISNSTIIFRNQYR
ncbi:MAG: distal tail protein Dit [Candidatus Heimdallarchaeaceae archaeon]